MTNAKMIYTMVVGLFVLLGIIIIGDFYISVKENKPPDESVIVFGTKCNSWVYRCDLWVSSKRAREER